ncbi:hypothetical protein GPECTOR_20g540 [Gonium pectorale]|uniref:BPL/LPL catalytic domain-containing protein n=1 Tax=Gonium pectorale TaxID=33097 RepID=A0A150GIQ2_GONPE|nr:hypothetical protein GPECTOR_20g540 [Gonium pectorale]|eukprot:KXZ49683.1 hypothetical protein GPECTOR_20g540 [Gonium pectorale]
MSTVAAAAGAARASAGVAPGGGPPYPVLAVCWSEEDAARVRAVAEQIAADSASAGAPAVLSLHTDPASLPSGGAPELDAAAVSAALRGQPPPTAAVGVGGGGGAGGSRSLGRVLLAAPLLGSTQEVLRTHGSALGDGAVVVADRQTGGKGRGGNVWTSPPGCLMFSALRRLRVASPAQAPFINYLVCIAVTRGVRQALQSVGLPPVDLRIKWPNDIYAGGLKVAGALINTTWQGNSFNVITGIGLNVNNRTPTTCLDQLVERAAATAAGGAAAVAGPPVHVPREAVLVGILSALEEVFDTFESSGFGPLEPEYLASWLHSGQELDFDDSDPSAPGGGAHGGGGGRVRLVVRGLSPSGFLLAEDPRVGGRYELTPDGNSLDMMAGLIRRKIN